MPIIKTNILPDNIQKALKNAGIEGFEIGSVWVKESYSNFYVRRITGIESTKKYGIRILYQDAEDWDATEWDEEHSKDLKDWKRECGIKLDKPFAEYRAEAAKVILGDISIESFKDKTSDSVTSETALVGKDSKKTLTALQTQLEDKYKKVELVKTFVSYEMKKRQRELEKIKEKLEGVLTIFEKKIKKIMRVITTIELYLGIDEELFQLQEGPAAPSETPITFRQMVLFMDEETAEDEKLGNVDYGGLDYSNIGDFDEWLLKDSNFKKLIPEQKGMIVFRPRRSSKDYGEGDKLGAAMKNHENKVTTYFLIRNGENLHRIFTGKIIILDRLFPQRKELDKLLKETAKIVEEDRYDAEEAKDKVEDAFYRYKKQAVFLQGLIDRTEIFHPLPIPGLSVFKMDIEENGKYFNFIYDDEATLPSGRKPFWDWVKKENKKITHGSRVVLTGNYRSHGYKLSDFKDRIFRYVSDYKAPALPNPGVYEVTKVFEEKTEALPHYYIDELESQGLIIKKGAGLVKRFCSGYEDHAHHFQPANKSIKVKLFAGDYIEAHDCTYKKEVLTILHNPKDEVYGGWGSYGSNERKNRIRWRIYKSDSFVLNYDQISLDDIEFYLYNRSDRENYLEMMPLLRTIREWRLKELENEKSFVSMVVGQLMAHKKSSSEVEIEKNVWKAVDWWKFKNKIKRPIDKDDTKALRMIVKKINSKTYITV